MDERRPFAFWVLAAVFGLFVLFLYGPMLTIILLAVVLMIIYGLTRLVDIRKEL